MGKLYVGVRVMVGVRVTVGLRVWLGVNVQVAVWVIAEVLVSVAAMVGLGNRVSVIAGVKDGTITGKAGIIVAVAAAFAKGKLHDGKRREKIIINTGITTGKFLFMQ